MLLKHFFPNKIAHSSYLLAGKVGCALIDPQRDVDLYIHQARKLGVTITHILQTHLHADSAQPPAGAVRHVPWPAPPG